MRRFLYSNLVLCLLMVLCLLAGVPALAEDNLLQNGDFEDINKAGFVGWATDMWRTEQGITTMHSEENGHESAHCAMIDNTFTNDARFIQTVRVKPYTLYRLSGWVKAEGLPTNGGGAGFSVNGSYQVYPCVYDTDGAWQQLVCYIRTHDAQNSMEVAVRLGFYEGDTTGCAFFDDVSLVEVDVVPWGYSEIYLEITNEFSKPQAAKPPNANAMLIFLCVLGVGAVLFIAYLCKKVFSKQPKALTKHSLSSSLLSVTPPMERMRPIDWIVMLSITILYAAISFIGLGSTVAPQTAWVSTSTNDAVIFDLGESQRFYMLYYGGIHRWDRSFPVAFSDDGQTWTDDVYARMYEGDCFTWQYLTPQTQNTDTKKEWASSAMQCRGRYVKIASDNPDLTLMEVAFRDFQGNLINAHATYTGSSQAGHGGIYNDDSGDGGINSDGNGDGNKDVNSMSNVGSGGDGKSNPYPIANLIDEQDAVPIDPSYFNGTYFDEIYHVRTAYEHAHALSTYEWTHPPLGKLLIMSGIKLFGMTPFGWRFMGALAGVLMVPAMYMLGKLLFKKTRFAMLAAFVMAFDMMHLTQTRIATIDSYAVLFIILMYICMFRYLQMSFFRDGYRTLIPLGLCGLFMGLGCASKWICLYAGIGLAVLFAWSMVQRYLEWRTGLVSDEELVRTRVRTYPRYLLGTLSSCVLFFIVIPAVIYYLSYIPHFAYEGGLTWERFLTVQKDMFGYHSGLTDGHPYMSAWYDWPLMLRPMWYYNGAYLQEGTISTILSMGNPAVWWMGAAAFLYVFYSWLRPHFTGEAVVDHRPAMLLLAFAAQFVPWMLVTRAIFIYHYFGSLPFVMLCIVYVFEIISKKHPHIVKWIQACYMLVVILLFVGFYPLATGVPVTRAWADAMNWLRVLRWQHLNYGFWLLY